MATTEDIQDFFKAYPLDLHNIHMAKNFEGRSSGEAFVVFQSEDVATRALLALNKAKMGSRYIEIFRQACLKNDFYTCRSSKSELISGTTSCSSHHVRCGISFLTNRNSTVDPDLSMKIHLHILVAALG